MGSVNRVRNKGHRTERRQIQSKTPRAEARLRNPVMIAGTIPCRRGNRPEKGRDVVSVTCFGPLNRMPRLARQVHRQMGRLPPRRSIGFAELQKNATPTIATLGADQTIRSRCPALRALATECTHPIYVTIATHFVKTICVAFLTHAPLRPEIEIGKVRYVAILHGILLLHV